MPEVAHMVTGLQEHGCCVLPAYFSGATTSSARWCAERVIDEIESRGNRSQICGRVSFGQSDTSIRFEGNTLNSPRLAPLLTLVADGVFGAAAQSHLGTTARLERMVIHRASASPVPLTDWHAGQERTGRRSVQVMIYLVPVHVSNGPFAYVLGSHHLVREITQHIVRVGGANTDVHLLEQIQRCARSHPLKGVAVAVDGLLQSVAEGEAPHAVTGPAGTAVLFDTAGVHRGGIVRRGQRLIVRAHYFELSSDRA